MRSGVHGGIVYIRKRDTQLPMQDIQVRQMLYYRHSTMCTLQDSSPALRSLAGPFAPSFV
jgi:hypothetical protein